MPRKDRREEHKKAILADAAALRHEEKSLESGSAASTYKLLASAGNFQPLTTQHNSTTSTQISSHHGTQKRTSVSGPGKGVKLGLAESRPWRWKIRCGDVAIGNGVDWPAPKRKR
jgi:hypothetical protein